MENDIETRLAHIKAAIAQLEAAWNVVRHSDDSRAEAMLDLRDAYNALDQNLACDRDHAFVDLINRLREAPR